MQLASRFPIAMNFNDAKSYVCFDFEEKYIYQPT